MKKSNILRAITPCLFIAVLCIPVSSLYSEGVFNSFKESITNIPKIFNKSDGKKDDVPLESDQTDQPSDDAVVSDDTPVADGENTAAMSMAEIATLIGENPDEYDIIYGFLRKMLSDDGNWNRTEQIRNYLALQLTKLMRIEITLNQLVQNLSLAHDLAAGTVEMTEERITELFKLQLLERQDTLYFEEYAKDLPRLNYQRKESLYFLDKKKAALSTITAEEIKNRESIALIKAANANLLKDIEFTKDDLSDKIRNAIIAFRKDQQKIGWKFALALGEAYVIKRKIEKKKLNELQAQRALETVESFIRSLEALKKNAKWLNNKQADLLRTTEASLLTWKIAESTGRSLYEKSQIDDDSLISEYDAQLDKHLSEMTAHHDEWASIDILPSEIEDEGAGEDDILVINHILYLVNAFELQSFRMVEPVKYQLNHLIKIQTIVHESFKALYSEMQYVSSPSINKSSEEFAFSQLFRSDFSTFGKYISSAEKLSSGSKSYAKKILSLNKSILKKDPLKLGNTEGLHYRIFVTLCQLEQQLPLISEQKQKISSSIDSTKPLIAIYKSKYELLDQAKDVLSDIIKETEDKEKKKELKALHDTLDLHYDKFKSLHKDVKKLHAASKDLKEMMELPQEIKGQLEPVLLQLTRYLDSVSDKKYADVISEKNVEIENKLKHLEFMWAIENKNEVMLPQAPSVNAMETMFDQLVAQQTLYGTEAKGLRTALSQSLLDNAGQFSSVTGIFDSLAQALKKVKKALNASDYSVSSSKNTGSGLTASSPLAELGKHYLSTAKPFLSASKSYQRYLQKYMELAPEKVMAAAVITQLSLNYIPQILASYEQSNALSGEIPLQINGYRKHVQDAEIDIARVELALSIITDFKLVSPSYRDAEYSGSLKLVLDQMVAEYEQVKYIERYWTKIRDATFNAQDSFTASKQLIGQFSKFSSLSFESADVLESAKDVISIIK